MPVKGQNGLLDRELAFALCGRSTNQRKEFETGGTPKGLLNALSERYTAAETHCTAPIGEVAKASIQEFPEFDEAGKKSESFESGTRLPQDLRPIPSRSAVRPSLQTRVHTLNRPHALRGHRDKDGIFVRNALPSVAVVVVRVLYWQIHGRLNRRRDQPQTLTRSPTITYFIRRTWNGTTIRADSITLKVAAAISWGTFLIVIPHIQPCHPTPAILSQVLQRVKLSRNLTFSAPLPKPSVDCFSYKTQLQISNPTRINAFSSGSIAHGTPLDSVEQSMRDSKLNAMGPLPSRCRHHYSSNAARVHHLPTPHTVKLHSTN
ncbi:hypothetical protein IWX49DRAFT_551755 [Phyllosticta citricarpa]